jgi:hypothetical protein
VSVSRPDSAGDIRRDFEVIEYRAYFIGYDGHFNGYEPLLCADDEAAIAKAKRLVERREAGRA